MSIESRLKTFGGINIKDLIATPAPGSALPELKRFDSDHRPLAFLSHTAIDTRAAKILAALLRDAGLKVWLDADSLKPGDRWMDEIENALKVADYFFLYVGPATGVGSMVDREARLGLERSVREPGFRLIPVLGPGAKPDSLSAFYTQYEWLDCRNGFPSAPEVKERIRAITSKPAEAVSPKVDPSSLPRLLSTLAPKAAGVVEVFFSYSRSDEKLRDKLDKHLSVLKRKGLVGSWHDRKIRAGTEFDLEISKHLYSANLILLLISADFISSDYCWGKEMALALDRHAAGTACVVPIILRPCDWRDAPFGKLQVLPTDGKPVASSSWPNTDSAFEDVAKGIRRAVEALLEG